MVHFRTWFIAFFFFLHCFYSIKSQVFQSRLKFETENNGFRLATSIDFEGRSFASCFSFRIFSCLACILCYLLPLNFSQISFHCFAFGAFPPVTLTFRFQWVVSDWVNNVTWRKWKPWYSCGHRSCLGRTLTLISSNEASFW